MRFVCAVAIFNATITHDHACITLPILEKWPVRVRQYTIQVNKLIDFDRLISDGFLCSKRHIFLICERILIIQVALSF